MTATQHLLTRHEAAESLRQSLRKIDQLIESGDLPAVRIGRSVRIRPAALDSFVEARETRTKISVRKGGRTA